MLSSEIETELCFTVMREIGSIFVSSCGKWRKESRISGSRNWFEPQFWHILYVKAWSIVNKFPSSVFLYVRRKNKELLQFVTLLCILSVIIQVNKLVKVNTLDTLIILFINSNTMSTKLENIIYERIDYLVKSWFLIIEKIGNLQRFMTRPRSHSGN